MKISRDTSLATGKGFECVSFMSAALNLKLKICHGLSS